MTWFPAIPLVDASRSEALVSRQRLGREPLHWRFQYDTPTACDVMYPATLVFNSVDGFVEAVRQRSISEIGCAMLKRIKPWEGGMFERHTSFLLLTARDHARDEVLACSVYLTTADVNGDDLWTPPADWKRQQARAEEVKHEVQKRLDAVPSIRVLDAAYHVHGDVHMRFASLSSPVTDDGNGTG